MVLDMPKEVVTKVLLGPSHCTCSVVWSKLIKVLQPGLGYKLQRWGVVCGYSSDWLSYTGFLNRSQQCPFSALYFLLIGKAWTNRGFDGYLGNVSGLLLGAWLTSETLFSDLRNESCVVRLDAGLVCQVSEVTTSGWLKTVKQVQV